jgi:hypothetical protein
MWKSSNSAPLRKTLLLSGANYLKEFQMTNLLKPASISIHVHKSS